MGAEGSYDVNEVTVEVDGARITKGEGAKGEFVRVGQDGTHFKPTTGSDGQVTLNKINDLRRPVLIRLLRSSPSNAILGPMKARAKVSIHIERREGGVLLDASGWVEERSPYNSGYDECVWELTSVG